MGLLFDREPVEALEGRLMCSRYWSGALQSSECVGVTEGGSWEDRLCSQATDVGIKVPSAGKAGDGQR